MKYIKVKNAKLRLLINTREKLSLIYKLLSNYFVVTNKDKTLQILKKKYRFSNKSKVHLNNICIVTNRSKAINKNFKCSRFVLRNMMSFGLIPGYKKAVW
jgi:ribosomal protein S14